MTSIAGDASRYGADRTVGRGGAFNGAEQTYDWAVRFSEKVKRAAPIAGTASTKPHGSILPQVLTDTMTGDPA